MKRFILISIGILLILLWGYLLYRFENYRLFILILPPVCLVNTIKNKKYRNRAITLFVILWSLLFQYESLRYFYLNKIFEKELPKTKFLFPPAGWIMFFHVDENYSHLEVYGKKGKKLQLIDPHDIVRTRTIGYDNSIY